MSFAEKIKKKLLDIGKKMNPDVKIKIIVTEMY